MRVSGPPYTEAEKQDLYRRIDGGPWTVLRTAKTPRSAEPGAAATNPETEATNQSTVGAADPATPLADGKMHALIPVLLLSSIVAGIGFLLCWIVTAPFKARRVAGRRREARERAVKLARMKPEVRDAINAAAFEQFYGMPSIPWTRIKGRISPIALASLLQDGLVYETTDSNMTALGGPTRASTAIRDASDVAAGRSPAGDHRPG